MKAAVDLHIHSCLSPCGDMEMTPNNIVNMALVKGLDIIAVSDHNSVENVPALIEAARDKPILVAPAIELETSEEIHLLCLFSSMEAAFAFQESVIEKLPMILNREDIFGEQLVCNAFDEPIRSIKNLLLTATSLGIEEAVKMVRDLGGAAVPAHIDRNSYSILSNLGSIPEELNFSYLEISKNCNQDRFFTCHPELLKYKTLQSSDAHYLGDILERQSFIEIEDLSVESLILSLRTK